MSAPPACRQGCLPRRHLVQFDARGGLAGHHRPDAAELVDDPLPLFRRDFIEICHGLTHQIGPFGPNWRSSKFGGGLVEARHQDGRFANARIVQTDRGNVHRSTRLSNPIAEDVCGRFGIGFDQLGELLAERSVDARRSRRQCGGGSVAVLVGATVGGRRGSVVPPARASVGSGPNSRTQQQQENQGNADAGEVFPPIAGPNARPSGSSALQSAAESAVAAAGVSRTCGSLALGGWRRGYQARYVISSALPTLPRQVWPLRSETVTFSGFNSA